MLIFRWGGGGGAIFFADGVACATKHSGVKMSYLLLQSKFGVELLWRITPDNYWQVSSHCKKSVPYVYTSSIVGVKAVAERI